VNKKKVHRLWREEGLQVKARSPRKRAGMSTTPHVTADAPNVVWALDFQFDSTIDGTAVKIASMVDEHTRDRYCTWPNDPSPPIAWSPNGKRLGLSPMTSQTRNPQQRGISAQTLQGWGVSRDVGDRALAMNE
jgi:hypothetical protein